MTTSTATQLLQEAPITVEQVKQVIKAMWYTAAKKRQEGRKGRQQPLVPMFSSAPGWGKSAAVYQAAEEIAAENGWAFLYQPTPAQLHSPEVEIDGHKVPFERCFFFQDIRLAMEGPLDQRGLPGRSADFPHMMDYLEPAGIPRRGQGIRLFDELPQAQKNVQAAIFQQIYDWQCGNVKIPHSVMQVAAGNPASSRGNYNEMGAALGNRMVHFNVQGTLKEWVGWALHNDVREELIAFHQFRNGELLHQFDPSKDDVKRFPSPRSWAFVSDLMELPGDVRFAAIVGAVGHYAASEFNTFLEVYKDLPDVDAILAGREKAVPDKRNVLFALVYSLVGALTDDATKVSNFVKYVTGDKMPKEFAVMAVRSCLKGTKPYITNDPDFRPWVLKNRAALAG